MDIEQLPLGEVRKIENVISMLNFALGMNVHHELTCTATEHEHAEEAGAEFDFDLTGAELAAFLIWEEEALDLVKKVRFGLATRGHLIPDSLIDYERLEADDGDHPPREVL